MSDKPHVKYQELTPFQQLMERVYGKQAQSLRATLAAGWPARDALPTTDPEADE